MKYDEKTGKKQPESRMDEVQLSFEALQKLGEESKGVFDRQVEIGWLLRDIDMNTAMLVDMLGLLLSKYGSESQSEEKKVQ